VTAIAATTRGVTLAALLAALGRPAWWILGLAGFLIRGGILLFLLAIVTLPSPLALSNVLAPIITPVYLGRLEPDTAALIGLVVAALLAWLVFGSWLAAAIEVVLVRDARAVALDEGLPVAATTGVGRLVVTRAAAAHLVSLIPLAFALGFGSLAIVDVAYRELVNPSDSGPIVVRVIGGALLPVAVIVVAWILGEIVGGVAVRRVVLLDEPVLEAVGRAAIGLVRHPVGGVVAPLLTTVVLAVDLAAVLLVVAIVWTDTRDRLVQPLTDPLATGLGLATFAGAWCLALVVTGLIASWRSVAMSFETDRAAAIAG
jgi:hypothetical protein